MSVEQSREAERIARAKVDGVVRQCREECEAAERKVKERWASLMDEARDNLRQAVVARVAAEDATADHPWTGKKVFRMEAQGRSYQRLPDKRIDGIVETYRSTTKLPENSARWRLPSIGQPIVRLLRKDGSPGLKVEVFSRAYREWKLAEEESVA